MSANNPFEVLRLDPSASEEEVVRQAGRLRQRVTDERSLNAVRQAVQELAGSAERRVPPDPLRRGGVRRLAARIGGRGAGHVALAVRGTRNRGGPGRGPAPERRAA